jgi:hypothetical protein
VTFEERSQAVAAAGFTDRQARFLVTVMLHAAVCLRRQYCDFAHIERGQKTHDFFEHLVRSGFATGYPCAHNRARLYHVHHKRLYRDIGEPNNRNRRRLFLGRAVERLMLLDVVLAHPDLTWLATERDKLAYFTLQRPERIPADACPQLVFGGDDTARTIRYFPDKLPIGVDDDRRTHVFCFLVVDTVTSDFRAFLHRHADLLRLLPAWAIRVLVPQHLAPAIPRYAAAFRDELAAPPSMATVEQARWYFRERAARARAPTSLPDERFDRATRAFASPRFRALYEAWRRAGERALDAVYSPILSEALTRGTGRLETYVLPHRYLHLLPLVGTA